MIDSLGEFLATRLSALRAPKRFTQFAGVGFVGAAVDNVVLFALVSATALGPVGGKVVAWVVAIGVIFAINERWTFAAYGSVGRRSLGYRLLRSYVVRFGGFLVTLSVLTILVYWAGIWYIVANLIGIGVGFFVNYTAESLYTWRVHHESP
ncbi:GtrA family protein [Halobacteria archaeon AArc-dxtr1]|nr:GtrA family protein [Halobacteria archaeon AArc-dxtr1]